MISVSDLWAAIDKFASDHDVNLAELAAEAELPSHALLLENRVSNDGQLCWPPLELLIQLVTMAGVSLRDFGIIIDRIEASKPTVLATRRRARTSPDTG